MDGPQNGTPQNDPGLSPHLAPVALLFWALKIHPKYLENETRETCVSESVNLESEFHNYSIGDSRKIAKSSACLRNAAARSSDHDYLG